MSEDLSKLGLIELLDLLEPVPDPPAISLWPQTAGWIFVGIAVLAAAAWCIRRFLLHRRANAYRRAALRQVAAAGEEPVALAAILRRAALAGFPRVDVASLYGEDWLAFLDRTYGGTAFQRGPGRALAVAPYREAASTESPASQTSLTSLTSEWISRHQAPPDAGR